MLFPLYLILERLIRKHIPKSRTQIFECGTEIRLPALELQEYAIAVGSELLHELASIARADEYCVHWNLRFHTEIIVYLSI
jgi:hypothetical protein